jgi:hypothetical protein
MNASTSFNTLAVSRLQAMREQRDNKNKELKIKAGSDTSIELPSAISNLITGSDFWITAKTNRYKKLIREGYLDDLLELAKLALTKDNPAHWFAKVCSVKAWERTLDFLKKLYSVRQTAEQVAQRIGEGLTKFVYKQIWKGKNVERHAITAQEVRHEKPKQSIARLFAYLCKQEGQEAPAA